MNISDWSIFLVDRGFWLVDASDWSIFLIGRGFWLVNSSWRGHRLWMGQGFWFGQFFLLVEVSDWSIRIEGVTGFWVVNVSDWSIFLIAVELRAPDLAQCCPLCLDYVLLIIGDFYWVTFPSSKSRQKTLAPFHLLAVIILRCLYSNFVCPTTMKIFFDDANLEIEGKDM